jgi:hypothetical protein
MPKGVKSYWRLHFHCIDSYIKPHQAIDLTEFRVLKALMI